MGKNNSEQSHKLFKCKQCGGDLELSPGTASLKCPYCQFENKIPLSEEDIEELDFHKYLSMAENDESCQETNVIECESCGAKTSFDPNIVSDDCPYCGTSLTLESGSLKAIKPKSLLPFNINREKARGLFTQWIKGLWYAPNELKKYTKMESKLSGIYVPYWTYDSDTTTFYRGQRGEDYYVTESYTVTVNGKSERRTRQVKKTRWYSVSGTVWNSFNDILVLASRSLPKKYAERLEPWDLNNLVPYQDEYLSGFKAECYQIGLEEGMSTAQDLMNDPIRNSIHRDIGGDHQRIQSMKVQYDNITFKHILLPVWLSAYRYKKKVYRFLVNARTGEVQGERPWSIVKIALTVLTIIAIIAGIFFFIKYKNEHHHPEMPPIEIHLNNRSNQF